MGTGISFIVCSLVYSILLLVTFYSKKRLGIFENKIYRLLIIINFIGLILEISNFYTVYHMDSIPIINVIVAHAYLLYLLTWMTLFTFYIIVISTKKNDLVEEQNIKNYKKKMKFWFIYYFIFAILILALPLDYNNSNDIIYSYGLAVNATYVAGFLCILVEIFYVIKNIKNIKSKKYLPVLIFLTIGTFVTILQAIYPSLLIVTSMETFVTFLMYFTIENPDMKMIEQLNIAKDEAVKANNAKSDFLSSMSHEIRTPLNAIVGFSECIEDSQTLAEAKENAHDVISASGTLLEIVNGILDISKIEAGKIEIINSDYSPAELFDSVVKLATARLGDKQLDFRVSIAQDIPKTLYGDHSNIKKIIVNLLTNAIKYTNTGFFEFKVVCVNTNDICRLIISVEDSGRGIKKDNIDKLFTKFQRLEEDRNTTIEGTGLGLAITKQLVELMGGNIIVQSIYGQGSKFTVAIDQRIELKEVNLDTPTTNPVDLKIDLTGKKILVVDDNKLNLKIANKILSLFNPTVELIETGQQCIDLIKSGNKYDLILMDDMMPHMRGVEALKILKEIPGFDTPTIALTANAITGIKEKYLADGFNDYLSKPIDRQELYRIINTYIKVSQPINQTSLPSNNVQVDNTEVKPQAVLPSLDLTGKRILVVDDNKLNIKIATMFLKPYNATVDAVLGGEECISKIYNHEKYDLIFMDDMMPRMNGVETFKKIKEIEGFDTPVVALTANAIIGSREKYLADGFNDYLSKPIIKTEFDRVLRTYIK